MLVQLWPSEHHSQENLQRGQPNAPAELYIKIKIQELSPQDEIPAQLRLGTDDCGGYCRKALVDVRIAEKLCVQTIARNSSFRTSNQFLYFSACSAPRNTTG